MSENKFQWTDETVEEFVDFYMNTQGNCPSELWGKGLIPHFKKQKQLVSKDYEILECFTEPKGLHDFTPYCLIKKCEIHSVRRNKDKEVFSVGDDNEYPTGHTETIKEFKISDIKPIDSTQNLMMFRTDNIWSNLSLAKKVKQPIPLFTIQDFKREIMEIINKIPNE